MKYSTDTYFLAFGRKLGKPVHFCNGCGLKGDNEPCIVTEGYNKLMVHLRGLCIFLNENKTLCRLYF